MKKWQIVIILVICTGMVLSLTLFGCKTTAAAQETTAAAQETTAAAQETTAAAQETTAAELHKVTYVLPRSIEVLDDAEVWAGIEMGYFADQGIELTLEQATGTTDMKMLAAGKAQFAIPSPTMALIGFGENIPLKSVMAIDQRNIFGVVVKSGSDIKDAKDLKGKSIAVGDSSWETGCGMYLLAAGFQNGDYTWVVAGENRAQMVEQGKADAAITWQKEWQLWNAQGMNFTFIPFEPYIKVPGNSITVTTTMLEKDPDLIKAFGRAFAESLYFTKLNPKATTEIVLKKWTAIKLTPEQALSSIEALNFIDNNENTEKNGYGWHSVDDWNSLKKWALAGGVLQKDVDVTTLFTNEFVAYFNDFDHAAIEADAQNYVVGQ